MILIAIFTSPYAWLMITVLGFLLFGKKFGRWIGLPEWATFKIGERRYDLPLIVLFCLATGFVLGRVTAPKSPGAAATDSNRWVVERIVSPDVIRLAQGDNKQSVRLINIRAPQPPDPAAEPALEYLTKILEGGEIALRQSDPPRFDSESGRVLTHLWVGSTHVNVKMVEAGWARYWAKDGVDEFADEFENAELAAKQRRRGIWNSDVTESPERDLLQSGAPAIRRD